MNRLLILTGAALLTGCGHSPPTRFFALDAMPPSRPILRVHLAPVQLDAVHIPAVLDRPEMVRRIGPNRLEVDDRDHWGAPLGQMMRQVLAEDLLRRLPAGAMVLPGAPRAPGARALVVNVLQLQADADGRVTLEASWTLMRGNPLRPVMGRNVQFAAGSVAAGAGGQAAAISQLLGELADQIATVLTST